MTEEAVRLSKRVAALVPCSRADAERYIEGGWVRVDGVITDQPQERVRPGQAVSLDAGASLLALAPLTLLLHQPAGADPVLPPPEQRWASDSGPRVTPSQLRQLQPLMPLPPGAGGLAVYSQDRRVLRKLTQDANFVEQELLVDVTGHLAEGGLARLSHGLVLRGQPLPPIRASWQSEQRLRLAIKGLDPVHVGWMCAQVGLQLVQLRRLRLGRVPLAGLPQGQWRTLLPHERF
ncbi:RNA-binding protein [Ramlibacter sp. AW1]|uniref:Dual-specificity RNA pseudouridine synthase RluF n=1 Tax=Ramlibacter aurantiacus TaxID=2801330 RepID=A0A936ZJV1_9BURK|nr:RNA pseudouridine synthase [Ramlibacter aurantiacus]MBL0422232.1 RNA-binding protein [Ramlibacter aurantiacus]